MAFKVKRRGRPAVAFKDRSVDGIAPAGFEFHKFDKKRKVVVYKKKDGI